MYVVHTCYSVHQDMRRSSDDVGDNDWTPLILRVLLSNTYKCGVADVNVGHAANLLCQVVGQVVINLGHGSSCSRTVSACGCEVTYETSIMFTIVPSFILIDIPIESPSLHHLL